MGEIHLICGKICSGKSWYARRLAEKENAVILSCDDLSLSLFPPLLGDKHDEVMARVKAYLHARALDILSTGTDVILEWGFWKRADRQNVRKFYEEKGIKVHWYHMDTSDETLIERIDRRNEQVLAGMNRSYYVDEGLFKKMTANFEKPDDAEMNGDWVVISDHDQIRP